MSMLKVGDRLPEFKLTATVDTDINKAFTEISYDSYPGKWLVLFFWPKDFTFVCPTEIVAFNDLNDQFKENNAVLLGGSTDSEFVHRAWRQYNKDLSNLSFPMLSDIKHELCNNLGILDSAAGVAQRATFIIDPEGIIRFNMVTDLSVGRNPEEVLRILRALQDGGLCPCNWQPGQNTINVAEAA
ncbi:alkylhydroperoxide reductase C [Candidatus Rickettsiella viridis]|uniref:Alkyl hydroperoxide reductase C n=2 Tax=Candidatus Rickettsiella viridis TaxID=676208 RepID=A0A2Z5UW31_9COXI|nr:alkylhydroperoxide reductase C [Candidatus Rickettsiella viridis]